MYLCPGCGKVELVLFVLYGVGSTTKIISHSPEQAHLLFPIDCNCKLQGTDLIGKYKDVLVVVKLSWSYLDFGPYMELVCSQESLFPTQKKSICYSLLILIVSYSEQASKGMSRLW